MTLLSTFQSPLKHLSSEGINSAPELGGRTFCRSGSRSTWGYRRCESRLRILFSSVAAHRREMSSRQKWKAQSTPEHTGVTRCPRLLIPHLLAAPAHFSFLFFFFCKIAYCFGHTFPLPSTGGHSCLFIFYLTLLLLLFSHHDEGFPTPCPPPLW